MIKKAEIIFETVDPFNNVIALTKQTWENHISFAHPEMLTAIAEIKITIEAPDNITIDSQYVSTYNYYRKHGNKVISSTQRIIKVCADISAGVIKTAYPTDRIKKSEVKIL